MKCYLKNSREIFTKYFFIFLFSPGLVSCGLQPLSKGEAPSLTKTVDIDHTSVKWQSIGNCWAYSHLGWAESLIKNATGQSLNFSETYLTYRHFEEQLINNFWITEVNTNGGFIGSMRLLKKYGLIQEGDFIPEEALMAKSQIQYLAVTELNESLKSGPLKFSRSLSVVRAELNRAFGIPDAAFEERVLLAKKPETFKLGTNSDSQTLTLADQIDHWSEWRWDLGIPPEDLPATSTSLSVTQTSLLKRVKQALNAGYPVIINWFVDFNALDDQGVFSLATLKSRGPGRQGYHSTVMEDYVVDGVDPTSGLPFETGEGNVPDSLKELAANEGRIRYFILKNSWGGAERLDRPSYSRFGEKGYSRLDASYLFAWVPTLATDGLGRVNGSDAIITSFVLPAGF